MLSSNITLYLFIYKILYVCKESIPIVHVLGTRVVDQCSTKKETFQRECIRVAILRSGDFANSWMSIGSCLKQQVVANTMCRFYNSNDSVFFYVEIIKSIGHKFFKTKRRYIPDFEFYLLNVSLFGRFNFKSILWRI